MQTLRVISIFGDSILKGVQLQRETNRYCVQDSIGLEAIAVMHALKLDNQSRFGCTIDKGAMLLNRQLDRGFRCDAALLEYGGNDADFDWAAISERPLDTHLPKTPLPKFIATLTDLISTLRAHDIVPILSTLPPISAERYLDWITRNGLNRDNILLWLGDANAIYRYQEQYSNAIASLAVQTHCLCVDLRAAFLSRRILLPYLCEDGIHPNDAGQKIIHDALNAMADAHCKTLPLPQ